LRAFYIYIKARIGIGIFPNIIQKSDTSQRLFYSERERKNAKEQLERSEHAIDIFRTNENFLFFFEQEKFYHHKKKTQNWRQNADQNETKEGCHYCLGGDERRSANHRRNVQETQIGKQNRVHSFRRRRGPELRSHGESFEDFRCVTYARLSSSLSLSLSSTDETTLFSLSFFLFNFFETTNKTDAAGADVIELGVPYSDPLADGPVIQAAATRALENGATLDKVIAMAKKTIDNGKGVKAPIVMFTYFNPIYQRGVEKFVQQIADAGARGLLIPDVPLEETYETSKICSKYGIDLVLLSTPTTPTERARQIALNTKGFVYLVSVTGVTGMQTNVASRVEELVADLRKVTDEPIAVGFGVSNAGHAKQIVNWGADGVIVGSALVRALGEAASEEEGLKAFEEKAKEIRSGACRD
jgi:tryptophan synthase alpha chain